MSDTPKGKMGDFLREVSNWDWEQFWRAERDATYTSNQAVIFALIRACAGEDLKAIRVSLNRMDGKLKTPVIIEAPKIFTIFPFADRINGVEVPILPQGDVPPVQEIVHTPDPEPEVAEDDLPSLSLRETLDKMSDYTRDTPAILVEFALHTEQWLRGEGPQPSTIPRVKSIVAAHLLVMAQKKNIDAMTEVFDQIDGKLAETIQLIGEDIYITSYSTTAPFGAIKNKDGVYQMVASAAQDIWASKLGGVIDV